MKNLLNKWVSKRKKTVRPFGVYSRSISVSQISKMGRLGQSLVVMSR